MIRVDILTNRSSWQSDKLNRWKKDNIHGMSHREGSHQCVQISEGSVPRRQSDTFDCYPTTGWGNGHEVKQKRFLLNIRKHFFFFLLRTWTRTGTGCPEKVQSLHLCRYSKAVRKWSWAIISGWPCLRRGVGSDDFWRSLITSAILWFCINQKIIHACIS